MTPEELVARAQEESNQEAKFKAIRVATILSRKLQTDRERSAFLQKQLGKVSDGADPAKLAAKAKETFSEVDAVRVACLAIAGAAADPLQRTEVEAAIAEQAASREMIGTGVMELGVVVGLALLIAKTEVWREPDGKWAFKIHPVGDQVIIQLLKFGTEALKRLA